MKKAKLFFFAAIIGALSAALIILYIFRDDMSGCPLCKLFPKSDDDEEFCYDDIEEMVFDEEDEEDDEEEIIEEAKPKCKRGYIPLKFCKAN